MALEFLRNGKSGITLAVHAVPRASRTEIVDITGDRCKMKVKAPPVDGEANEALIAFLAKLFGVPKRSVTLTSGATGKQKRFEIAGVTIEQAETTLSQQVKTRAQGKAER